MGTGIGEIKKALDKICDILLNEKEELTEIDSRLGDGDMGISMEKGALAVRGVLDSDQEQNISRLLSACGTAFNRAAPSTLGTLLSFSLLAVARDAGTKQELTEEDLVRIPSIIADTISVKGKAQVGDKTILDALLPFAETLKRRSEDNLPFAQAWKEAVLEAERGMESTKGMTARTGRAKWLDGRNKEYPDGGAVLCVKVVQGLEELFGSRGLEND